MHSLNQITIGHINHLGDIQLSQLLHLLLNTEAKKEKLDGWDASVPFNITTGDAGSDGKMVWTGNPAKTKWLTNKFTIFQNKATELIPSKCFEEILETEQKPNPRKLKAQIEKLVITNGCYILFTNKSIVDNGKDERIKEFRRAIKESAHNNADTFEIEVYDANKIKDWVNENINAILFVQVCNGITRPSGFRTWYELGLDIRESETPFQRNEIAESNIKAIRTIQNEKVIRITGHSGLGKTRLVFESFRSGAENTQFIEDFVYYDVGLSNNSAEIAKYIISHRNQQQGIIVIDNCDAETHEKMSELVKSQGQLKIITIGFDDRGTIQDPKLRLDRNNQRDLVSLIVEQKLGTSHDVADKNYIKDLSEGYPWMAVKFCDSVLKNGMNNLKQYPLDQFIQKLLFGTKEEDKQEYGVISACSVFSAFGFLDDSFSGLINPNLVKTLQAQMDFIREIIYDDPLSDSRFREICNKFRKEDIIEKRGTFYIVKPTILAIHLASHWLTITAPSKIKEIIETLKSVNLEVKFLDRLTDLDQMDKAKDLVSELWGAQGFFGSAEVLSTNWGSLLFRYVVEVNPIATVNSLENAFFNKPIQDLKNLTEPRRNLVWSLEKLVFRDASFAIAAKILFKFAVAENETWANNATHQFIQLFQIHLPGTEVDYSRRLDIVRWGLQFKDAEFTRIAILGLARGLQYDHFSRSGGAESQGGGAPLKDYSPTNWLEIFDYWKSILELIIPIAINGNPNAQIAKNAIVNSVRSIARHGKIELINDAIRRIIIGNNEFWPEAIEALKRTLNYEKGLPDVHIDRINELIELLSPKDLKTQIYLKVSKPEWSYSDIEDFSGKKQLQNAKILAERIIAENLLIEDLFEDILKGEQRQGFAFGYRLGELEKEPEIFLQKLLFVFENIPKNEQNPEVLVGFVSGTNNPELIQSAYESFLSNEKIAHQAFYFARVTKMNFEKVDYLFTAIDKYKLPVSYFSSFQYGRGSDVFSVEEIIKLCTKLKNYELTGRWTALSIIFMYCFQNEENWNQCKAFLKEFITERNMGITDGSIQTMEAYHWSETVGKLLIESEDVEFAKVIMHQIIEMCSDFIHHNQMDHYIPKVLRLLLDKYLKETWDILGTALISKDYMFLMNIRQSIGTKNGSNGEMGLLFENDQRNTLLFEWCKKHPDIAPKRFAGMMPLATKIGDRITWHPFSRKIIDTFGSQPGVLNELGANMGTYGTVGSRVGYLELLKNLVGELRDHEITEVKDWAQQYYSHYEKEIKLEKISNEEDTIS